eukprot:g11014.t1
MFSVFSILAVKATALFDGVVTAAVREATERRRIPTINERDDHNGAAAPLIATRLQYGEQVRGGSLQSTFPLFTRAAMPRSLEQLSVAHSTAERFLRYRGGTLPVPGSRSSSINNIISTATRFQYGEQIHAGSLQSAFPLFTGAAMPGSPEQLSALHSTAERFLRYPGRILSVHGSRSSSINNIISTATRFQYGEQVRGGSLQSAFPLFTRAAMPCSPEQLSVLHSAAERLLRYPGRIVAMRGSHGSSIYSIGTSLVNSNFGIRMGAAVAGSSIAGVPRTTDTIHDVAIPLMTLFTMPQRLSGVGPSNATGDGEGRTTVAATTGCKATDTGTGEDNAARVRVPESTPPLTPGTPCSFSSTPPVASDSKEYFGSFYDNDEGDESEENKSNTDRDDCGNDRDQDQDKDEGGDVGKVGDPLLGGDREGDGGSEVEVLPHVASFGCSSTFDDDDDDDDDDEKEEGEGGGEDDDDHDAPAAGYLTATGLNMELVESEGHNKDGGFGDILFVAAKKTGQLFAFKSAKDTAGGRRQMEREVQVLAKVSGNVSHIVQVEELRCKPSPMLLMHKEPGTLSSMLTDASNSIPREIVTVLCDVLAAVDGLLEKFGLLHRDIKPDNILVDQHGRGKLADFGMCVKALDASRPENIGDGTPAYSSPEASTPLGTTVASEVYAVAVIMIEGLMNNCPFGSEELLTAGADRLDDLQGRREDLLEAIEVAEEEREEEGRGDDDDDDDDDDDNKNGEASSRQKLELVRIQEHRLGVVSEDGWEPNDAALVLLAEMGPPLNLFVVQSGDDTRTTAGRGEEARKEAQADPRKLFEDNWVDWLTTLSRAECDEGLRQAVEVVLDRGMLHPDPRSRPQTAGAAKEVLLEALAVYEAAERAGEE